MSAFVFSSENMLSVAKWLSSLSGAIPWMFTTDGILRSSGFLLPLATKDEGDKNISWKMHQTKGQLS